MRMAIRTTRISKAWHAGWLAPAAARWALGVCAAVSAIIAGGIAVGAVVWDHVDLDGSLAACLWLWAVATLLRRLGADRIGAGFQTAALLLLLSLLVPLAAVTLATSALPWADDWLAAADRSLVPGLDWPGTMLALQRWPRVLLALAHSYASLGWQPFALVGAALLLRREALAWRFVTAWALALLACLLVFPFAPSTGAYVHFGIAAADVPAVRVAAAWGFLPILEGARGGGVAMLDGHVLAGIITMPSFHTAAAVVLGRAWIGLPALRWPMAALNAAMIASAVPIGGHYIVDVIAGAGVGLLAWRLSRRSPSDRRDTAGPPARA